MASFLLTGANGLLGRAVAQSLTAAGDEIICLGRTASHIAGAGFISADLSRPLQTSKLPKTVNAVIHLAQSDRFNEFPDGADEVFGVNVATLASLLDWACKAQTDAFVHASSGGLYGAGPQPFAETAPVSPRGRLAYYLSTKYSAELLADAYQNHFAVSALRYFFIYGPGQRPHMLMPRLIGNVRNGRPLTLQGDEGMRMNPIFVSDAAAATIKAARVKASGAFNVAGPAIVSIHRIGEIIGDAVGRAPEFEMRADETPNHLVADIARMTAVLGAPEVSPQTGLREMCV